MARKKKIKKASQSMEVQNDPPMPEAEQTLNSYCILEKDPENLSTPIFQRDQNSLKETPNEEDTFNKELETFVYKHKLSNHCIDDLLELLKHSTNVLKDKIPKSRYFLFKIPELKRNTKSIFLCKCLKIFGNPNEYCNTCTQKYLDCFTILNFEASVANLCLKYFVTNNNVFRLKVCLYTDGISKFNKSNKSIWPIYLVSADLDLRLRYKIENIILLGIFYGINKPNIQFFLSKIFENLYKSSELYFSINGIVFFIDIVFLVADKPAKALLLNFQNFNAKNFCPLCLCTSKTKFHHGKKKIYVPLMNNYSVTLRTKEATVALIYSSICTNGPEYGVKGSSFLYNLKSFDPTKGILIDYMHSICSGVFKTLVNFLFFEKFDSKPAPLRKFISQYDKFSKEFMPSFCLPKETALLSNWRVWKSKDYKTFFLYIFPLVQYRNRKFSEIRSTIMLLRNSIFLLLHNNLKNEILDLIDHQNLCFLSEISKIFDETIIKPNFHDLCHLASCYRVAGSLNQFSGFNFEHLNGCFARLAHGNKRLDFQIAKYINFRNLMNNNISEFHKSWKQSNFVSKDIYLSGKSSINNSYIYASPFFLGLNIFKILEYNRLTINGIKLATKKYNE